ncbi:hypothetical protein [Burkholderia multivorans]|uniref:hypothetical protein n=1 Tax=Burkholderia multivorans TaxID=87883 RepID=UPI001C229C8E|nr:hypothetical protein [Burkholderia multivorans]MBU9221053.1 hypothetical protein [Burkholderia multivorans]MBU9415857.1 hypothetical protein [Burkholderia multivorans]
MIGAAINWREVLFDLRRLGLMPTNGSRELRGAVSERRVRAYTEQLSEPLPVTLLGFFPILDTQDDR